MSLLIIKSSEEKVFCFQKDNLKLGYPLTADCLSSFGISLCVINLHMSS